MENKLPKFKILHRADSQPSPHPNSSILNSSVDQKIDENEENHNDTKPKPQPQQNSGETSTKQHARPIKEIRGILKGKMKQRTFVVLFADSEKEETVPIAQMHKCYMKDLLDFYEAHITQTVPLQNNNENPLPSPNISRPISV